MPISTKEDVATATSAYDFVVYDAKRKEYDMNQHRGNPILVGNIAMKCGLAPKGMAMATDIYHKYREQGVTVLGFPSNEFRNQNPGSEEDTIKESCSRFKADFPIMRKIEVNGENASPLFRWLKKEKPGILGTEGIKWNFTFFLLDGNGKVVERFAPGPSYEDVEKKLVRVLKNGGLAPSASSSTLSRTNSEAAGNGGGEPVAEGEQTLLAKEESNNNNNKGLEPQPKEKTTCCCC